MSSARFSQTHGIVPLTVDGDWNNGFSTDSINMAKWGHCTIIIIGDSSLDGNAVITVKGGLADAEETASVTFTYRYAAGDCASASSDVYGAAATSSSLTTTATSMDSRATIIEFDAEDLNVSGVQYQYATLVVSDAGSAGTCDILAILSEPRYEAAVMPTAVPTS